MAAAAIAIPGQGYRDAGTGESRDAERPGGAGGKKSQDFQIKNTVTSRIRTLPLYILRVVFTG